MDMIRNRLEKNLRRLEPWAKRNRYEAYRVYDRDIPEYPFILDRYADHFLVYDRSETIDEGKGRDLEFFAAMESLFPGSRDKWIVKKRERQEGLNQYEKTGNEGKRLRVRESDALFWVNLTDYLDTGLFLDHRPMRQKMKKLAAGKKLLNLFCYTGSVSVLAALGGARTVSVDMSNTYLDWARDNFVLNGLAPADHAFVAEDALKFLAADPGPERFDVIFLDPPTFSNSKRMERDFEVERDQEFLVSSCLKRLAPGGALYFSTNKRKFRLSEGVHATATVADLTEESLPQDFHDRKIHQCFRLQAKI